MKKPINVHILASSHPQFDEILDFPPRGVVFKTDRIKTKYHNWFNKFRINLHHKLMAILPIPRLIKLKTDADIIHSTRGILQIRPNKPWIVDLESGGIFTSFNYGALNNPLTKKIIHDALASKNCKRILPQSEAAKLDLLKAIDCRDFMDKIEVLYLAMRPCKRKKKKRQDGKIILSYVGKFFWGKGGQDVLEAYKILTKKYKNVELRFKGDVPEEYQNLKLPGLKFIKRYLSREKLFDVMYLNADIFVLPTTSDNYGVVFLEAMSAGLPLIGAKSFTVPELIEDGKNGFLVNNPYTWENYLLKGKRKGFRQKDYEKDIKKVHPEVVRQLVEKLSLLIKNKKLRDKMGQESRRIIEKGKLSINERNKKLLRIYREALKK